MQRRSGQVERLAFPGHTHDPGQPRYARIAAILKAEILDGRYPHGAPMPAEGALAERFAVSRLTMRRALELLAIAGLVVRRPGRGNGTRVNLPHRHRPRQLSMTDLMMGYTAMGGQTVVEMIAVGLIAAGPSVSGLLGCDTDAEVWHLVRRRLIDGRPFSLFSNYVPAGVGARFRPEEVRTAAIVRLIEALGYNVTHAEQDITACVADTSIARLLGIDPGDAVINVRRVAFAAGYGPIEYISVLYRPSDYNYRISLRRERSGGDELWKVSGAI